MPIYQFDCTRKRVALSYHLIQAGCLGRVGVRAVQSFACAILDCSLVDEIESVTSRSTHPPAILYPSIYLSVDLFLIFSLSIFLSCFLFFLSLSFFFILFYLRTISLYPFICQSYYLFVFFLSPFFFLRHGNSSKFHSFFSLIFPPLSISLFLSSFLYFFLLSLSKFSK